jgi:hypothetical protein
MLAKIFGLKHRTPDLPADLRQSVGESALVRLALDAAQAVVEQKPWLRAPGDSPSGPQRLLALLAYCYAAGIYASQDVARACRNDPAVRSLCAGSLPDWSAVWLFRNANRPWIEECLARVYGAPCVAAPTGGSREPATVHRFREEAAPDINGFARRKLRRAVWTDAAVFD